MRAKGSLFPAGRTERGYVPVGAPSRGKVAAVTSCSNPFSTIYGHDHLDVWFLHIVRYTGQKPATPTWYGVIPVCCGMFQAVSLLAGICHEVCNRLESQSRRGKISSRGLDVYPTWKCSPVDSMLSLFISVVRMSQGGYQVR